MSSISAGTTTTTGYVVTSDTTGALVLKTGASATTALTIDTSQNVGIGTASPTRKLVVSNAGAQGFEFGAGVGPSSGNELLNYNRSTSLYVPLTLYASTHAFYTGTSGATLGLVLDASGNVGIGTASPTSKLTIQGTAAAASTATVLTLFNSSDGGVGINFTNAVAAPLASINALVTGTGAGTDDGILQFSTATNGTNAEQMRLTSTGLGIGTTSPTTKLSITDSAGPIVRLVRTSNRFELSADTDFMSLNARDASTYITFKTADTERARISSTGNFLVNTTGNGSPGLGVANSQNISFPESTNNTSLATMFRQSSSGDLVLGSGVRYSNTANAFASSTGDAWARTAINVGYGAIKFFTAAEATVAVGTDTTLNERARITSGGNFLQMTGRRSNAHTLGNQQMWVSTTGSVANGASISLFTINEIYDNLCYELDIFINRGGYFAAKYAGVFGYNGFTTTLASGDTGAAVLTKTGTLFNETMTITNSSGGAVNAYIICLRVWGIDVSNNVSTGGDNLVTSAYLTRIE